MTTSRIEPDSLLGQFLGRKYPTGFQITLGWVNVPGEPDEPPRVIARYQPDGTGALVELDTEDQPDVQAERDRLMPLACGDCGTEADPVTLAVDHFDWCPNQR